MSIFEPTPHFPAPFPHPLGRSSTKNNAQDVPVQPQLRTHWLSGEEGVAGVQERPEEPSTLLPKPYSLLWRPSLFPATDWWNRVACGEAWRAIRGKGSEKDGDRPR